MTRDEALARLQSCREGDDRDPYPILMRMKRVFEAASTSDRQVLNEIVREWLVSDDPKERFDGAWLTDELHIEENLDLVRKLRDQAECRSDPAARYDWSKFNEIAGRLTSNG